MLDGKANGRSQRFLSIHSVASSLEKPLLIGQSRLIVVTMKALLTFVTDECLNNSRGPSFRNVALLHISHEKTRISQVLGCFQDL